MKIKLNVKFLNHLTCDEELAKESLIKENASPEIISKNLAELKANKISLKFNNEIVLELIVL